MRALAAIGFSSLAISLAAVEAASAADLAAPAPAAEAVAVSPIDVAFGMTLASQYISRGKAQSAGDPAVQGYAEVSLYDLFYAGAWGSSLNFSTSRGLSDPAAEIDLYAGVRPKWGPVTLDMGAVYYWYPGEARGFAEIDYWELSFKPSVAVGDWGRIGAALLWTNDFVGNGSNQTYLTGNATINLPNFTNNDKLSFYTSGEFGKRWVGRSETGFNSPDYLVWNAGLGVKYKAMKLDARYWDSTLSRNECVLSAGARSWCGDRYVLSLSFDTTLSALK